MKRQAGTHAEREDRRERKGEHGSSGRGASAHEEARREKSTYQTHNTENGTRERASTLWERVRGKRRGYSPVAISGEQEEIGHVHGDGDGYCRPMDTALGFTLDTQRHIHTHAHAHGRIGPRVSRFSFLPSPRPAWAARNHCESREACTRWRTDRTLITLSVLDQERSFSSPGWSR